MAGKDPPRAPGKPFLGDDDLMTELEAWDATFDALHTGPEPGTEQVEEMPAPMDWPEPAPAPAAAEVAPDVTIADLAPVRDDDFEPISRIDIDDQMTLDRALEARPEDDLETFERAPSVPTDVNRETDFSDLGTRGRPQTLGEMLGATSDITIDADHTRVQSRASTPLPEEFDDDVFTSASRPARAPSDPTAGYDDDVVPPPPPVVVPRTRSSPAIVRRTTGQMPAQNRDLTPPGGQRLAEFAEATRVVEADELERRVSAAMQVPAVDEDAYDDIEIDRAGDSAPMESEPEAPVARRTAHVVRREAPTRPPPPNAGPVIEMEIADQTPLPPAGPPSDAEDDFSDVAAAVGADADLEFTPPVLRAATPIPIDDLDEAIVAESDSELPPIGDEEDETSARTMIGAPRHEDLERMRESGSGRPPSIVDLYPRVKTPTSVPPLGAPGWPVADSAAIVEHRPHAKIETPAIESDAPPENEPFLDLETVARDWPEQAPLVASSTLDDAAAAALLVYEREVGTLDDSETSAALRIEAGRLCERLNDPERARVHYDAALLADPRAAGALRGLRRIARAACDLGECTRHLDTEIAVAGALERRPLGHYRVDLLMASHEQDLARVAVGEILDTAPSDIRALLAQLELAFLDGRADEFGAALEQIAHAVTDNELRAAVQSARGVLAAQHNDTAAAARWFQAAAESDPNAISARLGAVRQAAAQAAGGAAAQALLDVARQTSQSDPTTTAALALRAQQWAQVTENLDPEVAATASAMAAIAAPDDPLVARLAAEGGADGAAYAHWARCSSAPAERAYAAGRAAELDPTHAAELWTIVLADNPGDDYAAAQLRTVHVASDNIQAAIDVDLQIASDPARQRARLRAAFSMIALGQIDPAIELLVAGREATPDAIAISEALGEAYAAAGRWTDRAELFAELAKQPGPQLDPDVAKLRSAIAWEEAVGAAAAASPDGNDAELQRLTAAALEAWDQVLEHNPHDPAAHAAAMLLASRLGDRDVTGEVLARAQAAENQQTPESALAAASLGFRRARLAADDPQRVETLLHDMASPTLDDPRRTLAQVATAIRTGELGDAATALEERATMLDQQTQQTQQTPQTQQTQSQTQGQSKPGHEAAVLRLRAAQIALDVGDAARATKLLQLVEQALPGLGVVSDLLTAARRRAGDGPSVPRPRPAAAATGADAFVRIVRDADYAHQHGDAATALGLYQQALELRPNDPLAAIPLVRVATELDNPTPLTALALAQLRIAEQQTGDAGGEGAETSSGEDGVAKALAYERIAQIDGEIRSDTGAAQIALESASQADPSRIDLLHRLVRGYAANDEIGELMRLRRAELARLPEDASADRGALMIDLAGLSERDNLPEVELAEIYRGALAADPKARLALLHLEAIVRRAGASEELARLEEQIAWYFDGEAKAQAAFWTRAGETLAELGQIDEAVQRFGRAENVLPGHIPALEGWRQAALKGELWVDVAEAATRQATATTDLALRGALHHFAGVALMDKALISEQAMQSFRRALEADPHHKDAFLRLRILLEEDANHDDLATLLAQRLEVEDDLKAKIELHRALAELHRNFLSDRETATEHYRAILDYDPNDLRSHAAVADIAWEQGNWQEAADALMARARLERDPEILKTLCFRLGLIYADRLVDVPMALKAFQRALTYQPNDENTLIRLADLAAQIGEWKLALGACERLVKNEADPDRRVAHLHRVAKIFKDGFGDQKRAERALNLALDSSPTNDEALRELVEFYQAARDVQSARVHLNRVCGTMRSRIAQNPLDPVPYRVIARAMTAREETNQPGSIAIARAAAEIADLLGGAGEPEQKLLAQKPHADVAQMLRPEAGDLIFPRGIQPELRQVFQLLGDRIAKHVGINVQAYGVSRGDRVRTKDNPVAAVAQSVASSLGMNDLDVYISSRQPWVMVAEPTSPVSLVLGMGIAGAGTDAIRFAAGGALKLAQSSLAIPARLPLDDLGVLVVALLRLFQPDFPAGKVDQDAVSSQYQKLRRLIPTNLMNELRPFALAIDTRLDHRQLATDLRVAGLRAGLVTAGSVRAGLRILAAQADAELPSFLADPVALSLVSFALGEDFGILSR